MMLIVKQKDGKALPTDDFHHHISADTYSQLGDMEKERNWLKKVLTWSNFAQLQTYINKNEFKWI